MIRRDVANGKTDMLLFSTTRENDRTASVFDLLFICAPFIASSQRVPYSSPFRRSTFALNTNSTLICDRLRRH